MRRRRVRTVVGRSGGDKPEKKNDENKKMKNFNKNICTRPADNVCTYMY